MLNKRIFLIPLVMVGIFLIPAIVNSQETFSNESITNIRAIQKEFYDPDYVDNDSRVVYIIDVNYYLNVTGEPTNTYSIIKSRELIDVEINVNALNNMNKTIKNAIKNHAKDKWNYTLSDSKIMMLAYTKGNDI